MKLIIKILIDSPHYFGMKVSERLALIKFLLSTYSIMEEL
jgi:hypothetical protein